MEKTGCFGVDGIKEFIVPFNRKRGGEVVMCVGMSVIRQGVWDWGGGGGSRMSRFRTENNYLGWRELGK